MNGIYEIFGNTIMIELMITRKCTYHCAHCMYDCGPKESPDYMSDEVLAKVKKQIDFLKAVGMLVTVNLVGGEPTINFEKFAHIMDTVMTWDVSVTMTTNGWWLDSKKSTEKFFEIVSRYTHIDGKSHYFERNNIGLNIRISDDPYHKKERKTKDISLALYEIFNDKKLVKKYNIPTPDVHDPWLWRQFVNYDNEGFSSYYISPNGRGKNVTNIDAWIQKYSKDGNFCMVNFNRCENLHYELDGSISDACGFGSVYDFGTVDDNILFIILIIHQYKVERMNNRDVQKFTCSNCREMVQEWKKENLKKHRERLSVFNTLDVNTFTSIFEKAYSDSNYQ